MHTVYPCFEWNNSKILIFGVFTTNIKKKNTRNLFGKKPDLSASDVQGEWLMRVMAHLRVTLSVPLRHSLKKIL